MGYASYSKFSEALLPNHPEQVSKLQRSVVNLLPNHDFELSGYWSNVCYYNGQATFTYDMTEKYMGTRSMKVNKTNNEGNACLFMNFNKLEVGKTYTLSAYIKGTGTTVSYTHLDVYKRQDEAPPSGGHRRGGRRGGSPYGGEIYRGKPIRAVD